MTVEDHGQAPGDVAGEMTSVLRAPVVERPEKRVLASGEGPAPGLALLVIERGPNAGSRLLLEKAITSAGRHPHSDIFLDDVTVSRRHAEFRLIENGVVEIVDVGSLNGTYVNREPVDSAVLNHGDEVQLGKFRLVFLSGGPPTIQ